MIETLSPVTNRINKKRLSGTKAEQNIRVEVLEMCWSYLQMNFHKLSETNKVKVALTLATKNVPQEITGDGLRPVIQFVNFGEPIGDNKNPSRII